MKKISYKALLQHFSKRGHAYSWATSQNWGKWEDLEPSLQEPLRHNLTPPTPHAQDLELGTNGAVSSEHIVKMALVPDEQQRKLSIINVYTEGVCGRREAPCFALSPGWGSVSPGVGGSSRPASSHSRRRPGLRVRAQLLPNQ